MPRREIPKIPPMRPEPQRDRWGRYLLAGPGEDKTRGWTRATTLAHAISDTHGLTQWQRRMVLQGAAVRPELLRDVPTLVREIDDAPTWREAKAAKDALMAIADQAADAAGANDGSKLGTTLHTITEYADAGRLGEIEALIPSELYDDLAAYLARMADAGIERPAEYIERVLVNTEVDAAGTTDRILRMPAECASCGSPWKIGDLKTQKSVDYGFLEIAIQLAQYANADAMVDEDTGELEPMPTVCRCTGIVMHLPVGSGECTLFEVDLAAGWEAARLAFTVRQVRSESKKVGWRYSYVPTTETRVREAARAVAGPGAVQIADRALVDKLTEIWTEIDPLGLEAKAHALKLIDSAGHPRALVALWEDLDGRGLWDADMTARAAARKAQLAAEGVK